MTAATSPQVRQRRKRSRKIIRVWSFSMLSTNSVTAASARVDLLLEIPNALRHVGDLHGQVAHLIPDARRMGHSAQVLRSGASRGSEGLQDFFVPVQPLAQLVVLGQLL